MRLRGGNGCGILRQKETKGGVNMADSWETLKQDCAHCRGCALADTRTNVKITQEHGQWFQRGGVQMTAIYHPAALLRDEQKRPETFVDLKSIQAKIRELCEHTEC